MTERRERSMPVVYISPSDMMKEMEKAFDRFRKNIADFAYSPSGLSLSRIPAVDIKDEGDRYVLEADLPGVSKDHISVEIGQNSVFIKALKEEGMEEEKQGYLRRERGYMSFYRVIPIPPEVDQEKIEAKLENGVLRLDMVKIPQEVKEEPRKSVEIK